MTLDISVDVHITFVSLINFNTFINEVKISSCDKIFQVQYMLIELLLSFVFYSDFFFLEGIQALFKVQCATCTCTCLVCVQ